MCSSKDTVLLSNLSLSSPVEKVKANEILLRNCYDPPFLAKSGSPSIFLQRICPPLVAYTNLNAVDWTLLNGLMALFVADT